MATILVVEDEPSIAEIVALYLERAGFSVRTAADGQEALDESARWLPDLIVLDLMLPRIDGYEVLRRLRTTSDTPVIMLTARKTEVDRIAGLELGADDYVVKPFSAQELVSRVRAVLRRSRKADALPAGEPLTFDGLTIDAFVEDGARCRRGAAAHGSRVRPSAHSSPPSPARLQPRPAPGNGLGNDRFHRSEHGDSAYPSTP